MTRWRATIPASVLAAAAMTLAGCAHKTATSELSTTQPAAAVYTVKTAPVALAAPPPLITCPAKALENPPVVQGQEAAASSEEAGAATDEAMTEENEGAPQAANPTPPLQQGVQPTGSADKGEARKLVITCAQAQVPVKPQFASSCCTARIHFAFDSSDLNPAAKKVLQHAANCMKDNHGMKIAIVGHTDPLGSEEYNLELGKKRAGAVAMFLEGVGVPKDQLSTSSEGKNDPLCKGTDEDCTAIDRRTEVKPNLSSSLEPAGATTGSEAGSDTGSATGSEAASEGEGEVAKSQTP